MRFAAKSQNKLLEDVILTGLSNIMDEAICVVVLLRVA